MMHSPRFISIVARLLMEVILPPETRHSRTVAFSYPGVLDDIRRACTSRTQHRGRRLLALPSLHGSGGKKKTKKTNWGFSRHEGAESVAQFAS